MENDLVVAWFLGAGGLVLGVIAGGVRARSGHDGLRVVIGLTLGLLAGCVMSLELCREVQASPSSTAAIGYLFVPFPPITNAIGGAFGTAIVRVLMLGWSMNRAPVERR